MSDARSSLHTMVNLLADLCVFEGRKVTIEIINGTDIKWTYDPPLADEMILATVAMQEKSDAVVIAGNSPVIH